ncbi:MAG TPA: TonB-dependent receptor [Puia sp.]
MPPYSKKALLSLLAAIFLQCSFAQSGVIKGRIFNPFSNEPLPFANIQLQGTHLFTLSDSAGNYSIKKVTPGLYNLVASSVGYKTKIVFEIQVDNLKPALVDIPMENTADTIRQVEITARTDKSIESPLSSKTIGVNEIQRNPGGNRDISKVIQSLPGAGISAGFRNDIIIRGGAPNENRFYIDDIEIPVINHFATQGASGGPVGIINVDFLKNVNYYSGAFPADKGNMLSSLLDFKFKDGRNDHWVAAFTGGSSDLGLRAEGPVSAKSTLLLSVRRSYLQFLFKLLQLPFLPTYNDFQFKYKLRFNNKSELTLLGLGAIDVFKLNFNANKTELNQYTLNNIPSGSQWNYAVGAVYKNYHRNGYSTVVVSRNMLNKESDKFNGNNNGDPAQRRLKYRSQEIENKFRWEENSRRGSFSFNYGLSMEADRYTNNTFSILRNPQEIDTISYNTDLSFYRYGAFAQLNKLFFNDKLGISAGARLDGNSYSSSMNNPFQQFSPRVSVSYALTRRLSLNANTGLYYQLPAYTTLGFKDNNGVFVNKENNVRYIQSAHFVSGIEYNLPTNTRFSVEGFYKKYAHYPFSITKQISLANEGGDYGVVGDEAVQSTGEGRAYGVEFFLQQKLFKGFYGWIAYTYVRSEGKDKEGKFIPSAWDQRNLLNIVLGKKLRNNWEAGIKLRASGGSPYTPYDVNASSQVQVWNISGQGILNYDSVNKLRAKGTYELDIRIDKKYYFKKWDLNIYIDIQNITNAQTELAPYLNADTDANGQPVTDPNNTNPPHYKMHYLKNVNGNILPSIGLIIEF